MRRCLSLLIVMAFGTSFAAAQAERTAPAGPRRSPSQRQRTTDIGGPEGEAKLRWICKQLNPTAQQVQQIDALIAMYTAELEEQSANPLELMERLRDKAAEVEAARQAGDEARVAELQEELRNMAPGIRAENNFFDALQQYLTDEQKAKLPQVRRLAASIGDISMRPIHVLRAARSLGLSLEQERQLEQILDQYRKQEAANRPANKEAGKERVDQLAAKIRSILTPDQQPPFDAQIADLQTGAPPAAKVILQSEGKLVVPTPAGEGGQAND